MIRKKKMIIKKEVLAVYVYTVVRKDTDLRTVIKEKTKEKQKSQKGCR